jgi:hypothetical protein
MYYNSSSKRFRCYEDALWQDCISAVGRRLFQYVTDFMGASYTATNESAITFDSSSGSIAQGTATTARPGVATLSIAGSSSARVSLTGNSTFDNLFLGNSAVWTANAAFSVPTLSNGTVRFTLRFGFIDSVTAESTDGCFFRYSDNVNSGKWQGVCRDNTTESVCDTGVTVGAGNWDDIKVGVNSAGTLATFVVNDTSSCTINSNIPTAAGRLTTYGVYVQKNISTTTRTVDIDYMDIRGYSLQR